MSKLLIIGLVLVIVMLIIWVVWGELIVARLRRQRPLDDMDLRGTLGIAKDVPIGFESIRTGFEIAAPEATPEQLAALREKTEQYCVVMQTLTQPPALEVVWGTGNGELVSEAARP